MRIRTFLSIATAGCKIGTQRYFFRAGVVRIRTVVQVTCASQKSEKKEDETTKNINKGKNKQSESINENRFSINLGHNATCFGSCIYVQDSPLEHLPNRL